MFNEGFGAVCLQMSITFDCLHQNLSNQLQNEARTAKNPTQALDDQKTLRTAREKSNNSKLARKLGDFY